jgi:dCMP deaminase
VGRIFFKIGNAGFRARDVSAYALRLRAGSRSVCVGDNGSLPGTPHCEDDGCLIVDGHCVRTNHAEINALAQASRHGVSLDGATAYITNMPCSACSKALIAAGVVRVVIFSDYHKTLAERFFAESGVTLSRLTMPDRVINYDLREYTSARKGECRVEQGS